MTLFKLGRKASHSARFRQGSLALVMCLAIGLAIGLMMTLITSLGIASAPAQATPASPVTVPVELTPTENGYFPSVQISIPGTLGDIELTVMLDTGSSGLVLKASNAGGTVLNDATLEDTGLTVHQHYAACDVTAKLYTGTVNLLGESSTAVSVPGVPLMVGHCDSWPMAEGMDGVLGIGQGMDVYGVGPSYRFASPFTSLASDNDQGKYTKISFDSRTLTGALTLGDSTPPIGGLEFTSSNNDGFYNNNVKAHGHEVIDACYAIGAFNDCTGTPDLMTFDSGAPGGFIGTEALEAATANANGTQPDKVRDGTEVRLLQKIDDTQTTPLGTFTVGAPSFQLLNRPGDFPAGFEGYGWRNNSGSGFLLDREMLMNFVDGKVTVGPLVRPLSGITLGIAVGDPVADAEIGLAFGGLKKDEPYAVTVHSTPTEILTGFVNGLGRVFETGRMPRDLTAGWHRIEFSSTWANGNERISNLWIQVSEDGLLLAVSPTDPSLPNTSAADSSGAVGSSLLAIVTGAGLLIPVLLRRRSLLRRQHNR